MSKTSRHEAKSKWINFMTILLICSFASFVSTVHRTILPRFCKDRPSNAAALNEHLSLREWYFNHFDSKMKTRLPRIACQRRCYLLSLSFKTWERRLENENMWTKTREEMSWKISCRRRCCFITWAFRSKLENKNMWTNDLKSQRHDRLVYERQRSPPLTSQRSRKLRWMMRSSLVFQD